MNTRVDYLDTAKGIAIILVAVGHCLVSSSNPVNRLILSFHMPLFFIVSGILWEIRMYQFPLADMLKHRPRNF